MLGKIVAAGVLAGGLFTVPAGAATVRLSPDRTHQFGTTDGNIACTYTPPAARRKALMRCDVLRTSRGPRVAASFTPTGRTRVFTPRDAIVSGGARRALREGGALAVGAFRCSTSEAAMVCMSVRSPYGFALSRGTQSALSAPLA